RLGEKIDRIQISNVPHPDTLWTKEWAWKKTDKIRVLRHILKNFYISVHGEKRWSEFSPQKKLVAPPRITEVQTII
ncbi:MAG TPA: hypothetical protein VHM91_24410, partial [Verrucomicrobiales bacterium]|nr:hypothetical protein [Verrucomicrobiales bacterium]